MFALLSIVGTETPGATCGNPQYNRYGNLEIKGIFVLDILVSEPNCMSYKLIALGLEHHMGHKTIAKTPTRYESKSRCLER
jgi:hypothetical protein